MYYAQFFGSSALDPTKLVEACGDRAVIILDGRENENKLVETARLECKKRGYSAWQLKKGETFTRSAVITRVYTVGKD